MKEPIAPRCTWHSRPESFRTTKGTMMRKDEVAHALRELTRGLIRCQAALSNPLGSIEKVKEQIVMLTMASDNISNAVCLGSSEDASLRAEMVEHSATRRRLEAVLAFCRRSGIVFPPGVG